MGNVLITTGGPSSEEVTAAPKAGILPNVPVHSSSSQSGVKVSDDRVNPSVVERTDAGEV
jgi:hypothetical protein